MNQAPASDPHAETLELLRELRATLNALAVQPLAYHTCLLHDTARARERLDALRDYIEQQRQRWQTGAPVDLDAVWARLAVDICQLLEYYGRQEHNPTPGAPFYARSIVTPIHERPQN